MSTPDLERVEMTSHRKETLWAATYRERAERFIA